jgi:hypothetical protein
MSDLSRSIVRSLSAIAVGVVVALLGRLGLGDFAGSASAAVVAIVAALWATAVRVLEKRWPAVGWLLGAPGNPTYAQPDRTFPIGTSETVGK